MKNGTKILLPRFYRYKPKLKQIKKFINKIFERSHYKYNIIITIDKT